MLHSERPRNVSWLQAAGLLFGDWGTSRLYVLGLAFLVAGRSSFVLVCAMSALILGVGWAYTQICRIYPDGGGVYTAAKARSRTLAVIGALLLFADYTVTASLSAVDAFHYFGLGAHPAVVETKGDVDAGDKISIHREEAASGDGREPLFSWNSPGLWALISILAIGAFNLMGPKHSAGFAVLAALGMMAITLLVVFCALPTIIHWKSIDFGLPPTKLPPWPAWLAFVNIVLALSGVEAIANLTGVLHAPVFTTAKKSIWTVALEVAIFNILLCIAMIAIHPLGRDEHTADMLAFLSGHYVGHIGEILVRFIGGILLLSACNTAINGLMSICYVMSRDGEMPFVLQKLNSFGAPWIGAFVAAIVPALVLLFAHDIETLASLYAIGVVGAVAINCALCTIHPRLRKTWRKVVMGFLGILLLGIWVTLAYTKLHALAFVTIVLAIGLTARAITKAANKRRPKPSLLRQAILEQLPAQALMKPRIVLATAGSDTLAEPALSIAETEGAALVVCFVRQVALSYKVEAETRLTLETDIAAQQLIADFLNHGQKHGVPIIPMYDTGPNAAELIAETAAINNASRVLIGSSRRGALHKVIRGSFQRDLENLLPPDIPVQVISVESPADATPQTAGV